MGKFYIKIEKTEYGDKHELLVSHDGHYWSCIYLSVSELRKLRRNIAKYLKSLKDENLQ